MNADAGLDIHMVAIVAANTKQIFPEAVILLLRSRYNVLQMMLLSVFHEWTECEFLRCASWNLGSDGCSFVVGDWVIDGNTIRALHSLLALRYQTSGSNGASIRLNVVSMSLNALHNI